MLASLVVLIICGVVLLVSIVDLLNKQREKRVDKMFGYEPNGSQRIRHALPGILVFLSLIGAIISGYYLMSLLQ